MLTFLHVTALMATLVTPAGHSVLRGHLSVPDSEPVFTVDVLSSAILPSRAAAQSLLADTSAAPLTVFLDCDACDMDYVRTKIPWVAYVRDRTEAQVHILETSLPIGADGTLYTLAFLGRGPFAGVNDTLRWAAPPMATEDTLRRALTHLLQLGLIRYVAASPTGDALTVGYHSLVSTDTNSGAIVLPRDQWHGWVFNTGLTGNMTGQSSQKTGSWLSSASADRTTDALKADMSLSESYNWSSYVLPKQGTFRTATRSYDLSGQVLQSLNAHWSVGESGEVGNSSYDNERLWLRVAPALEYDVFPYEEATNRQLAVQAALGLVQMRFVDTTLGDRLALTSGDWRMSVAYAATQPWGSASVSVSTAALLTDFRKQNVECSANWNLRVAKGFSIMPSANFSWIRNQPYLSRAGLTADEVLVQQQQLSTNYSYSFSLGFSYTFGSSFDNVVNPRFNTGSVLSSGAGSL